MLLDRKHVDMSVDDREKNVFDRAVDAGKVAFDKVKLKVTNIEINKNVAFKARLFLNKNVSLKVLIVVILVALGVGRFSKGFSKHYDLSDLYVGTYTDYYGQENLAIVSEKNGDNNEKYYVEINDAFNSQDIELTNIRSIYTCLDDKELKTARKKENKYTTNELNKMLETIKDKDNERKLEEERALEEERRKEEEIAAEVANQVKKLEKRYRIDDYCIGIYQNVKGEWQCDIFRKSMNYYYQYKDLFTASIYEGDSFLTKLAVVDPIVIVLNEAEIQDALDLGGLTETQLDNLKERVMDIVNSNKYRKLNDYIARQKMYTNYTSSPKEKSSTTEEDNDKYSSLADNVYLTSDINCVIYCSADEADTKILLYDFFTDRYFDENGVIPYGSDDVGSFFENGKILMDKTSILTFDTEENKISLGKILDKESLTINEIRAICIGLNNIGTQQLQEIKENSEEQGLVNAR